MAGIGGGGITGGLTGAALGECLLTTKERQTLSLKKQNGLWIVCPKGRYEKLFEERLTENDTCRRSASRGLLGALSGGALGSHWTRQISKEFPEKKSRKKESNAKNRLKQAMIFPSLGGGGILLGKDNIPVQFQAGWGNLLGVLPVPEIGIRIGDESKGVSITGPIPGMGIDLGKLKGSSTYYRPGIPGMLSGEKDKDKKLFADDKSKKKKKKTKKTKASDKGKKKMNTHLKLAYDYGVQKALEDAGLTKESGTLGTRGTRSIEIEPLDVRCLGSGTKQRALLLERLGAV